MDEQEKGWVPTENKAVTPAENKKARLLTIRINRGRRIAGVGEAGEVVKMSAAEALDFISQGLAELVKE